MRVNLRTNITSKNIKDMFLIFQTINKEMSIIERVLYFIVKQIKDMKIKFLVALTKYRPYKMEM